MTDHPFMNQLLQKLPPLSFGRILVQEPEGSDCAVISIDEVKATDLASFGADLERIGFVRKNTHSFGEALFTVFTKDTLALYVSYYPTIEQLRIVGEENSAYLTLPQEPVVRNGAPSLFTQLELQDFGLSYLVRLCDGRFLVFDGGWEFEPDADNLMAELYRQSPDEVPRIAAWIFTHPHIDHYRCFLIFHEKYAGQFVVERYLYNFPILSEEYFNEGDLHELPHLQRMEALIKADGVPVYRPHSGQVYQFANVRMDILSSLDDTCQPPLDFNTISLIVKLHVDGQSILFCGDGYFQPNFLEERYGTYLKSHILQVTHHGFNGATVSGHKLIDPAVCLVPCFHYDFYRYIDVYYATNQTLLYDLNVQEILTGGDGNGSNIVLELPYTPKPHGRDSYLNKLHTAQKEIGSTSWFFADMTSEDCTFSLLNTTITDPDAYAHLYFDDPKEQVHFIKIPLRRGAVTKINFATGEGIDGDALYFNRSALAKKGLPEGKPFTVHIFSKAPIIVWSSKPPVYTA